MLLDETTIDFNIKKPTESYPQLYPILLAVYLSYSGQVWNTVKPDRKQKPVQGRTSELTLMH